MAGFLIPFGQMLGEAGAGVAEGKLIGDQAETTRINNQLLRLQLQQSVGDENARNQLLQKLRSDPNVNPMMLLAVQTGNKDLLTYFAKQGATTDKASIFDQKAIEDPQNAAKWQQAAEYFRHGFDFNQSMVMAHLPNTAYQDPTASERRGQEISAHTPMGELGAGSTGGGVGAGNLVNTRDPAQLAAVAASLDKQLAAGGMSPEQRKSIIQNMVYGGSAAPLGGGSAPVAPVGGGGSAGPVMPPTVSGDKEASDAALRGNSFAGWRKANPQFEGMPFSDAAKEFARAQAALRREEKPLLKMESDDGIHVNLVKTDPRTLKTINKVPWGTKGIPQKIQELASAIRTATELIPQLEASAKSITARDRKQFLQDYAYYNSPGWLKAARFGYKMTPNNARFFGLAGQIMSNMSGAYGGGAVKSVRLYQTLLSHVPEPGDNSTTVLEKLDAIKNGILTAEKNTLRDVYNNPIYYSPGVGVTPLNADDEKLLGEAGLGGP